MPRVSFFLQSPKDLPQPGSLCTEVLLVPVSLARPKFLSTPTLPWELTRYSPPRLRARPAQAHRPDCVPYSARSAQARLRPAFTRSGHTSNLSPSHSQVAGPGSALCAGSRHSPSPLVCLPHHSRRCAPFADLTGLGYSAGAPLTLAHVALPRIPLRSVALACYPALTSPLAPSRPGPARPESARPGSAGSARHGPSRPGPTTDPTPSLSPLTLRWLVRARHSPQGSSHPLSLLASRSV